VRAFAELRGYSERHLDMHAPKFILVEAIYPEDVKGALEARYSFLAQLSHDDRLGRLL
jgi:hypothetical protein